MCQALNQGYSGACDMVATARGFTVQMSAQAGTIHGDRSTEQGYPTPLTGVTQGRLSGGGTTTTTGDKRAEMSQVRGYEEHSLKTFQNNGESLGKCHLGTLSTLSWPEGLYFSPALGARVGGRPKSISRKLFVQQTAFQEPPNPEWHFLPFVWALLSHFSSPLGHILSL